MRRRPPNVPLPARIDGTIYYYDRKQQVERPSPQARYFFDYGSGNKAVPIRLLKLAFGANSSGTDLYLQFFPRNRILVGDGTEIPEISILVPDGSSYSYTPAMGGREWQTTGFWWAASLTPSVYTIAAQQLTLHIEGVL